MTETDNPAAELDQIERSIDIDAPADRVFALISRPGWWINQGDVEAEPKLSYEGDVAVVVNDQWGKFRIQAVSSEPPTYVSYRWLDREDPTVGTTVEFWISERDDDAGVTVRVLESGFTTLGNTPDQVKEHLAENTQGWEAELDAARRFVTEQG